MIKEPATEEEKVQQIGEVKQLPKVEQVLEAVSPVTTAGVTDGDDTEEEKNREHQDLQEAYKK